MRAVDMDAADVLMRSARRKYLNDPERNTVVEVAIACLIATGCGDHRHALDPALVASMALELAGHPAGNGQRITPPEGAENGRSES